MLYDQGTYAQTHKLRRLTEGATVPILDDIAELFRVYREGCESVGANPALPDFGEWISGTGEYQEVGPCAITW